MNLARICSLMFQCVINTIIVQFKETVSRQSQNPKGRLASCTRPHDVTKQHDCVSSVKHKRCHFEKCTGRSFLFAVAMNGTSGLKK